MTEISTPDSNPETNQNFEAQSASQPVSPLIPISPPPKRIKHTRTAYTHNQKKWLWDLYKQRTQNEPKPPSYLSLADAFHRKYGGEWLGDATIGRCVTNKGS